MKESKNFAQPKCTTEKTNLRKFIIGKIAVYIVFFSFVAYNFNTVVRGIQVFLLDLYTRGLTIRSVEDFDSLVTWAGLQQMMFNKTDTLLASRSTVHNSGVQIDAFEGIMNVSSVAIQEQLRSSFAAANELDYFMDLSSEKLPTHLNYRVWTTSNCLSVTVTTTSCDILVWFHGGGWALGSHRAMYAAAEATVAASPNRLILVSVEYRLAYLRGEQHGHPAALLDAISSVLWVQKHAPEIWKLSFRQIFIGGDSAGGNLASLASVYLNQLSKISNTARHPLVAGQILQSPVVDCPMTKRKSYSLYSSNSWPLGYYLDETMMLAFFSLYTRTTISDIKRAASIWCGPSVVPIRRKDLAFSPATLILVNEWDVLRDEE
eukprot:Filipodium_phascolosomae@DN847_c0_g1_i2.p1